MNKNTFIAWNNLIEYIRENLIDNQSVTKEMIAEIKALMDYINLWFASDSEEKMTYSDLLNVFMQADGMIKAELDGKNYDSSDDRFIGACNCVRQYLDLVFSEEKEKILETYCNKSAGVSVNATTTVPSVVWDEYKKKLDEIKKRENATQYREFTQLGAYATHIMAVAKGLIGFRKHGEQIYLTCKDGFLCTEEELAALPNN